MKSKKTKSPITALTHNLLFTSDGVVWATWSLNPLPYGLRPLKERQGVRAAHTNLLRSIGSGEMLLLGLASPIDPASVVAATIDGVDLKAHPGAVQEAQANLDRLQGVDMGQRLFYLSVPLPNRGLEAVRAPLVCAVDRMKREMALPWKPPSPDEVSRRLAQAEKIRRSLPHAFEARPVTPHEHLWILDHACTRGIPDARIPPGWGARGEDDLVVRMTGMPTPILDVSGQTDADRGIREKVNPLARERRFLKVQTDQGISYQTHLAVAAPPDGGMFFPGGEWLANLDTTGIQVDFCQRVRVTASRDVTRRNIKALRELNDQVDQRSTDSSMYFASGGLDSQIQDLAEYVALMTAEKNEVETESTTIFTIAAPERQEMEDSVEAFSHVVGPAGWGFTLTREPAGAQSELWWACQPGTSTDRVTASLSQVTTSRALSAAVPVVTTQLGDHTGALFALGTHGGVLTPVLMDLEGAATKLNVSCSMAVVGEPGSGKSVLLKTLALLLADRGSHVVAIDRSETAEWVTALQDVEGLRVVDISSTAQVSLDPLRVLGPSERSKYAQNLLVSLLGVSATSSAAGLIGAVLEDDYRADHHLSCLHDVVEHLGGLNEVEAKDLARRLNTFASQSFTRVVFDPELPAMSLDDPAVVFRTQALELPKAEELASPHRFAAMSVQKVFSRAIYAQLVAIARMICFATSSRLDILVADEAHALTLSDESTRDLEYLVRDGRKHLGGLLMGSHDPEEDFGDSEVLRHLISWRVIMREKDEVLARRALEWLGIDPSPDMIEMVTKDTSPVPEGQDIPDPDRLGEALVRDARSRFGTIKVIVPASGTRATDVLSTPQGEPQSERVRSS